MSSSILRRNSSKKGLEKLQRITVQRSLEDAEEIERERRRRARSSSSTEPFQPTVTPQDSPRTALPLDNQRPNGLIPGCPSSLEEDEGFSDWTHLNRRKQGPMKHTDVETHLNGTRHSKLQLSCSSTQQSKLCDLNVNDNIPFLKTRPPLSNQKHLDEDGVEEERERRVNITSVEREEGEPRRMKSHESSFRKNPNQNSGTDEKEEKKTEMKISYTSTVLLQQNGRQYSTNGQAERRTHDSASEEVFMKSSEENQQQSETTGDQTHEEVQRMREEERERKRRDVMEKLKRLSISSGDPEEPFSPLSPRSPSYMISERTESLNRSIKKKNSIKKTQPPTIISKLDGRLEQYNHAIEECSKEGNVVKVMDVPTPPEPVSARKNLFEGGEAWNQNSAKAMSSKDTEGMKVGVADLINQWVKGSPDTNDKGSKVAYQDVKAGEVRNIKSMWENLNETSPQDRSCAKGLAGKRYKFVESGHGKYEKVFISNETN
ncbi:lymphocyte specific protein 1 b isoform 2 [Danio rerio]|uniref:Lymphocyte specific protein 1 b isoform 2 n=1 Tax=Danio rerio TaxID=7955 RepID=A0AB13A9D5_DANRE|nr:lymphocyte specific protein 1 b isoform 2 [Danio rerio]|eukprot:XP_005166494.1 caldesmon, smooth muscle-like isoform X2 [Danio rerio]